MAEPNKAITRPKSPWTVGTDSPFVKSYPFRLAQLKIPSFAPAASAQLDLKLLTNVLLDELGYTCPKVSLIVHPRHPTR